MKKKWILVLVAVGMILIAGAFVMLKLTPPASPLMGFVKTVILPHSGENVTLVKNPGSALYANTDSGRRILYYDVVYKGTTRWLYYADDEMEYNYSSAYEPYRYKCLRGNCNWLNDKIESSNTCDRSFIVCYPNGTYVKVYTNGTRAYNINDWNYLFNSSTVVIGMKTNTWGVVTEEFDPDATVAEFEKALKQYNSETNSSLKIQITGDNIKRLTSYGYNVWTLCTSPVHIQSRKIGSDIILSVYREERVRESGSGCPRS